ncbi:MAG: hypothetical protein C5B55_13470 [Blastocatellia bacterium]|nr:MAG: hypothetical protein C5B55_13470 [Blastocatellia bacterium]
MSRLYPTHSAITHLAPRSWLSMPDRSRAFRKLALFAICLTVAAAFLVIKTFAQNQTTATATQAPAEKTVDEVQKNIQVLKGLPQSQLIPVMNFMGASLGVRCNYCHVNKGGVWDYASDEKGEKKSAREMISLVMNTNKNTFKGSPEVSCYTCHRGRTQVAHTVSFPMPTPEPRPSAQAQGQAPAQTPGQTQAQPQGEGQQQREALPTPEEILAKYYQAIGGSAAIDKLTSRVMKGTAVTSNGTELGYEIAQSGPEMMLATITTDQGVIERGFNGTAGWEKSARGIRDLSAAELTYFRRYSSLLRDIKLQDQFSRISVAGKPKIDGRYVYVLRATTATGQREQLYFDAETGLLIRRSLSITTPVGTIPEQVEFSDYRDVDGMKVPFVVKVSSTDPNVNVTRKFTEVKLNVPVEAKRFNKPA